MQDRYYISGTESAPGKMVERTASMLAILLAIYSGFRLTDISNTVSEEHKSGSRDALSVSANIRCRHL
jgi:hypothetical protein